MLTGTVRTITIGSYAFEGPYSDASSLQERSGVYVILCRRDGKYYVTDVGESGQVRTRVQTHERENCWIRSCSGTLTYAGHYTNEAARMRIEREIRAQYNPPCGDR